MNRKIAHSYEKEFQGNYRGPKGKKFMYKQFKELLLENHLKLMHEQHEILDKSIENWKKGYDIIYHQIDDIAKVGMRI